MIAYDRMYFRVREAKLAHNVTKDCGRAAAIPHNPLTEFRPNFPKTQKNPQKHIYKRYKTYDNVRKKQETSYEMQV